MSDFQRSERGGITLLAVRGSLDALSATQLKAEVVAIGDSGAKKVVVDLSALSLLDSSGVGVLISLFKRIRAVGGQVLYAGVRSQPKEVFRLLRLDRSLDLSATVDEAIGKLGSA
jgi:anti-sigma B factor antagonist